MLRAVDPVTHLLTGAALGRSGFNRMSRYATLTMVLAAEAPDLDTLWSIKGPVYGFLHHRGWTHTFVGLPVDAAAVLGAVYLVHRWRAGRARAAEPTSSTTTGDRHKPPRWATLYGLALIALLSHLLLDWTNNYGLRPFFPFNPRWYAGSFVFIVEPVMLLLLAGGLLWPVLSRLISSEMGARRTAYPSRAPALAALCCILLLYAVRGYERVHAQDLAEGADYGNVPLLRSTVSPYPINPFQWHAVVETPDFFQVATVDSLSGQVSTTAQEDLFYKPAETEDTLAAKRSLLGRAYLDWSHFALVQQGSEQTADGLTPVTFRDLRYFYDTLAFHGRSETPLTGMAFVTDEHTVARTEMDGKVQR